MLRLQCYSGEPLQQYIPQLVRLSTPLSYDFPYVYGGDLAYKERYLQTYIDSPGSVIVLAFEGGGKCRRNRKRYTATI
ncbi:hypothetical protein ACFVYJ_04735 [Pontibacter sp. JAM-7]|uniref:hypothetical protein n=1 Tax=Pontibacter sp. JAM-7 TaxID=3366581 RepID=UPI003AF82461